MPNPATSDEVGKPHGDSISDPSQSTSEPQTVHRPCPVCGAEARPGDVKVKAPVRAEALESDQRDEYWRGFRSRSCFFDFARCPSCSLLFCPTYYSQEALNDLYSSMPDNTAGAAADVLSDTQGGYIEFLAVQRPLTGTYLEIGPDIGLATRAATTKGNLDQVKLVEPNRGVHDELRQSTGSVPVEVVKDLAELSGPTDADNVVLIHVLDHLIKPVEYLRELRNHMKPGGYLLAVVHNEASLLRKVLGVRWPPFCLQHPQLYAAETLRSLFTAAGFQVVASKPTTNVFPMRHVVSTGASLVGLDGSWTQHVPETPLRLRLGNIMMVAHS
jgi:SAM-dependent methyltransferase